MIAIVDYSLGNLASIKNALKRLDLKSFITQDGNKISQTSLIILPGVGSASQGMKNLKRLKLFNALKNLIKQGKPVLGICLGMQLLFAKSEEGNTPCLGIIKGSVKKFTSNKKIPQIGWNQIKIKSQKVKVKNLFKKIPDNSYFYFINSYYCIPEDKTIIAAETTYGEKFASLIVKENIVATQFHPEKSGMLGQQLLNNIFKHFNLLKE